MFSGNFPEFPNKTQLKNLNLIWNAGSKGENLQDRALERCNLNTQPGQILNPTSRNLQRRASRWAPRRLRSGDLLPFHLRLLPPTQRSQPNSKCHGCGCNDSPKRNSDWTNHEEKLENHFGQLCSLLFWDARSMSGKALEHGMPSIRYSEELFFEPSSVVGANSLRWTHCCVDSTVSI